MTECALTHRPGRSPGRWASARFFAGLFLATHFLATHLCAQASEDSWPYQVRAGDTLIGIRDTLLVPGADWQSLQRLNRVANPRQLAPGSTLQIPVRLLRTSEATAEVVHTHGDVQIVRGGASAAAGNQVLSSGQLLSSGDTVRTGAQSSAALRFADGTRVTMRPDSLLTIERSVR